MLLFRLVSCVVSVLNCRLDHNYSIAFSSGEIGSACFKEVYLYRLVLLSNKVKGETQARICSKQAQQMSISYTTLKQSERKKPKLESQHFPTSSSSPIHCPRKERLLYYTLEQSKRKKTEAKKKSGSYNCDRA